MADKIRQSISRRDHYQTALRAIAKEIQDDFSAAIDQRCDMVCGEVSIPSNGRSGVFVAFSVAAEHRQALDDVMGDVAKTHHGRYVIEQNDGVLNVDLLLDRRP